MDANRQTPDAARGVPPDPEERAQVARLRLLLSALQRGLGHELSNDFVVLNGLAGLLKAEEAQRLSDEGRDYLRRLTAAAARAQALVAALADVARLGRPAPTTGTADLADAAAEAVAAVKHQLPRRVIDYRGPDRTLGLAVPQPTLYRVLFLILKRLATAAPDDSPTRLSVSAGVAGAAEVRIDDGGRAALGEKAERLFEPFGGDVGLDLFLARWLAEGWGGGVRAEPRPGGGNVFIVTCPLSLVPGPSQNGGPATRDQGQGTRDKGQAP